MADMNAYLTACSFALMRFRDKPDLRQAYACGLADAAAIASALAGTAPGKQGERAAGIAALGAIQQTVANRVGLPTKAMFGIDPAKPPSNDEIDDLNDDIVGILGGPKP